MDFRDELTKVCLEYDLETPAFHVEKGKVQLDFRQNVKRELPKVEFFENLLFLVNDVEKVKYDFHLSNNISREIVSVVRNVEFINSSGNLVELEKLRDDEISNTEFLDKVKYYLEEKHEDFIEDVTGIVEVYEDFLWSENL